MTAAYRPGARVSVLRINGERVECYILRWPLDYLRHIGEFYSVGIVTGPPRASRGRPRKGAEAPRRVEGKEIGMYEGRDIRLLPGRPAKY